MKFVIITGMSGGGKSIALKMLEDAGFYCVDNLPVVLIEKFMELIAIPDTGIAKVALGIDVRADQSFVDVEKNMDSLKEKGHIFEILFMDANDATLLKRYKETRRMHPLATGDSVRIEDGIKKEREILASMKKKADYVIDTSKLLTRELKEELDKIFIDNKQYNNLIVNIVSFGFKNGIPADADLVFDVRFLPNPFYIEELKYITGNEKAVQDYVMSFAESGMFLEKLLDMLIFTLPGYVREGKYQLVVAIGCTGGQHRSVTLANKLYEKMKGVGDYGIHISHRDIR